MDLSDSSVGSELADSFSDLSSLSVVKKVVEDLENVFFLLVAIAIVTSILLFFAGNGTETDFLPLAAGNTWVYKRTVMPNKMVSYLIEVAPFWWTGS